jgi:hypothetical protein
MSSGPAPTTRKSWPEPGQFNEAVQNLATSVSDRELQGGEAELGALGLPMPYAGNFADVYKVHCPATGNTWAVKFFKREVRDLRERYKAISDQLIVAQLPFTVDFRYIDEGVRIGGAWYPLVKMRWIEGQSLNRFVAQSLFQPKLLDQLFDLWVKVANRLRLAGVAHADLQHGNVVLVPHGDQGKLLLKLIDYDGMYVPALAGKQSGELGHANYQHPRREKTKAYNAELDRFSHLAICCALRCLSAGGMPLWERFNNEENLLFTAHDFADSSESKLFRELWTLRNPDARALVGHLALATQQPLEQAPLIDELVQDGRIRPLTADQQHEVQSLLFKGSSPATIPQTTVEPADPNRNTGTVVLQPKSPVAAAIAVEPSVAPVQIKPAPAKPAQEVVEAELVQPLSLATALLAPLLMFDRLLGWLAGPEHLLLHNFMRVVSVGVAVSAGPAAYYAATAANKPQPVALVTNIEPAPTERPPQPIVELVPEPLSETEPAPEEVPPEPDNGDLSGSTDAPNGFGPSGFGPPGFGPAIGSGNPLEPGNQPPSPPGSVGRPFEKLAVLAGDLRLLPLLPFKTNDKPASLGQLQLTSADDLGVSLVGSELVFPSSHSVALVESTAGPGEARRWNLVCRNVNAVGGGFGPRRPGAAGFGSSPVGQEEQLGQFALKPDFTLTFGWTAAAKPSMPVAALRHCLMELHAAGDTAICALGAPQRIPSPELSFDSSQGQATVALRELDTASLPASTSLQASLSLAGRVLSPSPFVLGQYSDAGAPGSDLAASGFASTRVEGTDGLGPVLEVTGTFGFDPRKPGSGRITIIPVVYKRSGDGYSVDPQQLSLARLDKLRKDADVPTKKPVKRAERKASSPGVAVARRNECAYR